jgi:tellurite resistance protein TerC
VSFAASTANAIPPLFEVVSLLAVGLILLADMALLIKRPHVPSIRECAAWLAAYATLALAFAGLLAWVGGPQPCGEFISGWLTEYSLSVDNLFVFMLIMGRFAVPAGQQQRVLMAGIVLALVLRGACIAAGAAIIDHFSWVFFIFGGFLLYTAVTLIREGIGKNEEYTGNALVSFVSKILPMTPTYHGGKLVARTGEGRLFTPMLVVFIAIGSTDLLFAFDSIPAIFGLTKSAFIVFSTNLFALMGLRQLYFLIGGLLKRLVYLPYGLAAILAFIGVKLILEALATNSLPFLGGGKPFDWAPEFPVWISLSAIMVILSVTVTASLIHAHRATEPTGP